MREQDQNRLLRGYEQMLRRLREMMDNPDALTRPRLSDALDTAKAEAVEQGHLTAEEADRIGEYLRRDLEGAASYSATHGDQDLAGWLRMDLQLIEDWLWDRFVSVADKTKLELMELQNELAGPRLYRSGEIAGPGTLVCTHCSNELQFTRVTHIPHCPKCDRTEFVRPQDDIPQPNFGP